MNGEDGFCSRSSSIQSRIALALPLDKLYQSECAEGDDTPSPHLPSLTIRFESNASPMLALHLSQRVRVLVVMTATSQKNVTANDPLELAKCFTLPRLSALYIAELVTNNVQHPSLVPFVLGSLAWSTLYATRSSQRLDCGKC